MVTGNARLDPTGKISLKKNYEGFGEGYIFFGDKVSTSSQASFSWRMFDWIFSYFSFPNVLKKSLPQPFRITVFECSRETKSL